jgi:hypothetical protein
MKKSVCKKLYLNLDGVLIGKNSPRDINNAISLGMNDSFINTYREEEHVALGKSDNDIMEEFVNSVYYDGIENVEMEMSIPMKLMTNTMTTMPNIIMTILIT